LFVAGVQRPVDPDLKDWQSLDSECQAGAQPYSKMGMPMNGQGDNDVTVVTFNRVRKAS